LVSENAGFLTVLSTGGQGRTRIYALPLFVEGGIQGYLETGSSLDRLDESMNRLALLLTGTTAVGLLAALLGGWLIAGSALRPASDMAATARTIALSKGFSRRLPGTGRRDELGRLADTFNEMLSSLDEAYRTQQRFVADASHELRTPLTVLQANLELLQRTPVSDSEAYEETMALLRQEVSRMSRLVADLLVLARADAGQELKWARVELDRVLIDTLKEARPVAGGLKLSITEIDQVEIDGDPDRVKQLLLILIDNAVRYTPEGGEVRLGLRRDGGEAVVTVADTGIGIASEDLPYIFERFYRADKARSRAQGGTGLGLSIARWIVDRHGGAISVESTPEKGSTFRVRLPESRAAAPRTSPRL
ncbi:MAG TPA: ATP-binding protein, partial [Chloroflexota bacterium]